MVKEYVDIINGGFELIAGVLCWLNVVEILKDKCVKGISWTAQTFFYIWGLWSLFYYIWLDQWVSLLCGIMLIVASTIWFFLAIFYKMKEK